MAQLFPKRVSLVFANSRCNDVSFSLAATFDLGGACFAWVDVQFGECISDLTFLIDDAAATAQESHASSPNPMKEWLDGM